MKRTVVVLALVGWFAAAEQARAGCNACSSQGDCIELTGLSGNCECRIRIRNNLQICTPLGVCDPNNPGSCGGGGPQPVSTSKQLAVDARLIDHLWSMNDLLGAAFLGSTDIGFAADGRALKSVLYVGETKGVARRADGSAFAWTLTLNPEGDDIAFELVLEETKTFVRESFRGRFDRGGGRGFVNGAGLAQSWDLSGGEPRKR